jgi:hypothetical protein
VDDSPRWKAWSKNEGRKPERRPQLDASFRSSAGTCAALEAIAGCYELLQAKPPQPNRKPNRTWQGIGDLYFELFLAARITRPNSLGRLSALTHFGYCRSDPKHLSLPEDTANAEEWAGDRIALHSMPPKKGNMRVQDVMTKSVAFCHPDANLATVTAQMWEHSCGQLPVVDNAGKVAAVITDRDICIALGTRNQRAAEVNVSDVICRAPVLCKASDDLRSRTQDYGRRASAPTRRHPGCGRFCHCAQNSAPPVNGRAQSTNTSPQQSGKAGSRTRELKLLTLTT